VDFLQEQYQRGISGKDELERLLATVMSNGYTIKEHLDAIKQQAANERRKYEADLANFSLPPSPHKLVDLTKTYSAYKKIAMDEGVAQLIRGEVIALHWGFDSPAPCVIPAHQWRLLQIDYHTDKAHYDGRTYTGLRFLSNTDFNASPDMPDMETSKPWLIPDDRDKPPAKEDWHIAARYFYRLHKKANSKLLKKEIVKLVLNDLADNKLCKRGGKELPSEIAISIILQNIEI
jgi:hypothetical protein